MKVVFTYAEGALALTGAAFIAKKIYDGAAKIKAAFAAFKKAL